jgi:hypothetical protein
VLDTAGHPGIGNDWWKGMNVDFGDVDGNGYLDIYVTNILEKRYKTDEGNMLWINCPDPNCPGGRGFKNVGKQTGTYDGGWGWAGKFADFDNDGRLDIFTVNGFVTGDPNRNYWFAIQEMVTQTKNQTADARDWPPFGDRDLSGHEPSRLYMQIASPASKRPRELSFVDVAARAGVTDTYNGRGIAIADFNLDGHLDMYVANQGAPSSYYVNDTYKGLKSSTHKSHAFLRMTLVGRPDLPIRVGDRAFASTVDAVGARVTLCTKTGNQIREVQGGMGFASQSEFAVHFGVPDVDAIERITIQWPSGRLQEFVGDKARSMLNRHFRIVEGGDEVAGL